MPLPKALIRLLPAWLLASVVFAFLWPVKATASQNYSIRIWNSEDGLPQNSVNCLAQTPDGYLWIGTRSGGLARFDGVRFVTFNPQNTPQLKDVEYETLSVDSKGTLWITAGNESVAALTDGHFRLVRQRNAAPRWHPLHLVAEDSSSVYLATYATAIYEVPRNGAVNQARRLELHPQQRGPMPGDFFQSRDGGVSYLTDSGAIARLQLNTNGVETSSIFKLSSPATGMTKDMWGRIWVASNHQIGVMEDGHFKDLTPTNGPPPVSIRRLVAGGDGGIWVWERNRLRKMKSEKWVDEAQGFHPNVDVNELKFFSDSRGGLWVINYGVGLWHVKPDGSTALLTKKDGLPSDFITCWLQDDEGNIWIGTKDSGLAQIRPRWFKDYSIASGIPGEVVQSVCEDAQGTIWVGTAIGGLAREEGDRFMPVSLPAIPGTPIENVTVYPDRSNGVWIGTVKDGVFRYLNGKLTRPFSVAAVRNQTVCALLQDSSGRIWMGNGTGAYCWDHGKLTTFGSRQGFVENEGVRALAEGPPGTIWFGTASDLWRLTNGNLTQYSPPSTWANARVAAILPDTNGVVWLGTLGGGLQRFQAGTFTRITTENGLPDDSITQLLEDESGHLWGGTYAGIFRAAKTDLTAAATGQKQRIPCPSYGVSDGLPAQTYSGWFEPACWRSRDGRLWFTTVKGLLSFFPNQVGENHHPPPVVIEEMRVDGVKRDFPAKPSQATTSAATSDERPLLIKPGRHYVDFRFTGLDFTTPDKVLFRWRLEPGESRWHESSKERQASYGPLLPGAYRFRVLAANNDGVWNDQGATLVFTVLPHFWETGWFKVGLGILLLTLFAFAIAATMRRRHRAQLDRLERIHEVERERSRIARDLHDDIGTSLTRINMLSGLVSHEQTSPAEIQDLTKQIRATSRNIVAELNEIVWAVNPKNDNLIELLGYVGNFAEAFCRNTSIRCRLKFDEDIPERPVTSEVRHNLFLAFKEAVNNAVKHAGADELWVRARVDHQELILTVEDDGTGVVTDRPPEPGTGHGLVNIQQRLQRLGGKCTLRKNGDRGTIVEFRLPLN